MVLVIGYGNGACGDDGVGPRVVERLAETPAPGGIEYLSAYQLAPELAEPISRVSTVIFVDASVGNQPGRIHWQRITGEQNGAFSHHVTPGTILSMASALYGVHPLAYLYTIEGRNFELGDAFSVEVEAALPEFIGHVRARIAECVGMGADS